MSKTDSSFERLLTVSIPETKHGELIQYAKRHGFANFSALVRYALESFDARKGLSAPEAARQVSFRIPDDLRGSIDKQAKKTGVSLGHLIRTALESLPEKPAVTAKAAGKPRAAKPAAKAPRQEGGEQEGDKTGQKRP